MQIFFCRLGLLAQGLDLQLQLIDLVVDAQKVDAAEKAEVESKLNELKETLKGSDTAAIKAATEALTQVFYKLSEKMYQQANPQGGQPGANPGCDPNCQGDCGNGGDNGQQYYDADYTVVDDDKK